MPEPGNNVVTNMMDVLENKQDTEPSVAPDSAEGGHNSVVESEEAPEPERNESNVITAPSEHVAEPEMEAVVGGGSTPLGTDVPEEAIVVKVSKLIIPYTGPFKECDSIKLNPKGVEKPEYCCDNTQPGLLHYAAVYTIVHADGTTEDVCAQCASHYEASSET